MNTIKFMDAGAQEIYDSYLKKVFHVMAGMDASFKDNMLMEINSHIYEGINQLEEGTELEKLKLLLQGLGEPRDYLKAMVVANASRKGLLYQFRPFYKGFFRVSTYSFKYVSFFAVYLLLFLMAFVFVAKIFVPSQTGLFFKGNEPVAFGFVRDIGHTREVLQGWFFPVIMGLWLLLYLLLGELLKVVRNSSRT